MGSREIGFRVPPTLGEHSREVLRELGLSGERITQLQQRRII